MWKCVIFLCSFSLHISSSPSSIDALLFQLEMTVSSFNKYPTLSSSQLARLSTLLSPLCARYDLSLRSQRSVLSNGRIVPLAENDKKQNDSFMTQIVPTRSSVMDSSSSQVTATSDLDVERQALVALFTSTNGSNWSQKDGWNTSLSVCSWFGITCDPDGHPFEISLTGNILQGVIPPEIGNLSMLQQISLNSNFLTGLPSDIGRLSSLRFLDISNNYIQGPLPREIGSLSALVFLSLANNPLKEIPKEIGQLQNLIDLFLGTASLSGGFPWPFLQLTNLAVLNLENNNLQGPLPPEIGNLRFLGSLGISNNHFTGPLPAEIGNFTDLTILSLGQNEFSGALPLSVFRLPLSHLDVSSNKFSGFFPSEIGTMTQLTTLALDNNEFEGPLPPEIGRLQKLIILDVSYNHFSGPIPSEIGLLQLTTADFSHNNFTFLPNFLAKNLDISYNAFSTLNMSFNGSLIDASYNPFLSSLSPTFWASPNLAILRVRYCSLNNLAQFSPPLTFPVSSPYFEELSLDGNFLGEWVSFNEAFFTILSSFTLRILSARNSSLSGIFDFTPFPLGFFTFLDLGENPLLSSLECSFTCATYEYFPYLSFFYIDHTDICMQGCEMPQKTVIKTIDISFSRACMDGAYLNLISLERLTFKNTSSPSSPSSSSVLPPYLCIPLDEDLIVDNRNVSVYFPPQRLTCPQRQTKISGGILDGDFHFLKSRGCFCASPYFWDGTKCTQCPENVICDPYVNGGKNFILGSFYPLYKNALALPALYPFAQLIECVTVTACNPSAAASPFPPLSSSSSSFLPPSSYQTKNNNNQEEEEEQKICEEGRDKNSRACSHCTKGFFALDVQCLECFSSTPFFVIFLLPLSIFLLAFYLWERSFSPYGQAAGFSICLFGLQLLVVVEGFFHRHSLSSQQRDLPDFLMVFRQAVNFRLWSFECWNSSIDFRHYAYIQLLLPLCSLFWILLSKLTHIQYRARFWYVMCFFLDLGYFPLCITVFEIFTCDEYGYLSVAPYLHCGGDLLALQIVGGICIVLYGIGIPVWFNYVLYQNRQNFRSSDMSYLSFLIDNLNEADPRIVGWPIYKYVSRFLLAIVIAQMPRHHQWPPLILITCFAIIAIIHIHTYPYRNRIDNMLELFVYSSCGVVFLMSMLEATEEYRSFEWLRAALYYFVSFVLLLGIAAYFLTPLWRKWRRRGEGGGQDGTPLIVAKTESPDVILY